MLRNIDKFDQVEVEKKVLDFWEKNKIFEKSLNKKGKEYVFYEGPPTANGKPGIHHVVARCFKDIIPRYKTMRGYRVPRKAGWDTHGLPVELQAEKELGLSNKQDIEKYGIGKFNQYCKELIWRFKDEFEYMTKRMGYWIDLKNPYVTYKNAYIESVWWVFS
ncbi:MAG: isoleucine--tRNA ligase, partial [Candidatus Harrisonbacteria bacterium CG10_big_fil_rev_8_21_14_0_10_38_8]